MSGREGGKGITGWRVCVVCVRFTYGVGRMTSRRPPWTNTASTGRDTTNGKSVTQLSRLQG